MLNVVYIFLGIFGLFFGSFLNVLIYRLPKMLPFVKGRSFCPKCRHKLSWFDNIPLLSFILLRGKCRYCKKSISLRYPLVELITGVLFVLSVSRLNYLSNLSYVEIAETVLKLALISGLIIIFFVDLEYQIIPEEIVVPLIVLYLTKFLVVLFLSISPDYYLLITSCFPILSAVGSFLFFYLIYLITKKKGMGFGDVKLAFLMGLVLGYPKIIFALYLSFLTGGITGVILILIGKKKFGQTIPFGPFLVLATVVFLLRGDEILGFLMKFF